MVPVEPLLRDGTEFDFPFNRVLYLCKSIPNNRISDDVPSGLVLRLSGKLFLLYQNYILMLRAASFLALVSGFIGMAAYPAEDPKFGDRLFPVNSTIAHFFLPGERSAPMGGSIVEGTVTDTSTQTRVLMLNYSAYDSAYANKVRRTLLRKIPGCVITDFWDGSNDDLTAALSNQDAVIIAYPSGGTPAAVKGYGKVLAQYARQGGGVVLTGTHEFATLQQLGLFDLDFGYFCADPTIHETMAEHPILAGTNTEFILRNYAYPLDISDPNFITLADVRGYPVLGYKVLGRGKVVYLGLEYYYDEPEPASILANTIGWLVPPKNQPPITNGSGAESWSRTVKHSEETLFAGSGNLKAEIFDLKIYPNPYVNKATLDIDLTKISTVSIDMTDETGRIVAVLLPRKSLNVGLYRIELPNLSPGIYFIQCRSGEETIVKKVVKTAS